MPLYCLTDNDLVGPSVGVVFKQEKKEEGAVFAFRSRSGLLGSRLVEESTLASYWYWYVSLCVYVDLFWSSVCVY